MEKTTITTLQELQNANYFATKKYLQNNKYNVMEGVSDNLFFRQPQQVSNYDLILVNVQESPRLVDMHNR